MYLTSVAHGAHPGHVHSRILVSQYDGRSVLSRVRRSVSKAIGDARQLLDACSATRLERRCFGCGCHCGVKWPGPTIGLRRQFSDPIARFDSRHCNRLALCRGVWQMSQRNLLLLLLAIAVSYVCYVQGEQNPYGRYVADGLATIKRSFARPGAESRAVRCGDARHGRACCSSTAMSIRSFSARRRPARCGAKFTSNLAASACGSASWAKPPQLMIVGPADPGTPAAKANLQPGDRILPIDDKPTAGMRMNDAQALVRGEPGTSLRLIGAVSK